MSGLEHASGGINKCRIGPKNEDERIKWWQIIINVEHKNLKGPRCPGS